MTSRVVFCFVLTGTTMFFPFLTHYIFPAENEGFYIILGVAGITGMTTATLQCTITGFCNYLPVEYIMVRFATISLNLKMNSITFQPAVCVVVEYVDCHSIAGQSIAGIAAGMLRVLVNVVQSHSAMDTELNALIYFGIGGALNVGCGLSFLYAIRSAFVRFHLRDYFWTRKYRGIRGTVSDRLHDNVLQRADTETILKKMVDDSLPTPKPSDFAQTPTVGPDGSPQLTHFGYTDIAKTQVISAPKSRRKRRGKERKEVPPNGAIEVDSDSGSSSGEDVEDTVEFTLSTTATDAFSINNSTVGTSALSNGHRVVIPAVTERTESGRRRRNKKKRKKKHKKKGHSGGGDGDAGEGAATFLGVFRKIKLLFLSLFLIFFVTFLPFPGMLVSLESEYEWIREGGWMSVFLVLIYNVTDYIGRQFVAALTTFSFSKRTLWIGCAWRLLLYPVFVVLYKGTIQNDWIAYGATAALGLTNGHFCCLCFMWAPSMVNAKEQPLMGSMMSFALVMGIVLGSNTTLLLNTLHVL